MTDDNELPPYPLSTSFGQFQEVKREHLVDTYDMQEGALYLNGLPIDAKELGALQGLLEPQFALAMREVSPYFGVGKTVCALWTEGVVLGARHVVNAVRDGWTPDDDRQA